MKLMMVDDNENVHMWSVDSDVHPHTIGVGGPMPDDSNKRIQAIDLDRHVAIATDGDEQWLPRKWAEIETRGDGIPKLVVRDREGNVLAPSRPADEVSPRVTPLEG